MGQTGNATEQHALDLASSEVETHNILLTRPRHILCSTHAGLGALEMLLTIGSFTHSMQVPAVIRSGARSTIGRGMQDTQLGGSILGPKLVMYPPCVPLVAIKGRAGTSNFGNSCRHRYPFRIDVRNRIR